MSADTADGTRRETNREGAGERCVEWCYMSIWECVVFRTSSCGRGRVSEKHVTRLKGAEGKGSKRTGEEFDVALELDMQLKPNDSSPPWPTIDSFPLRRRLERWRSRKRSRV